MAYMTKTVIILYSVLTVNGMSDGSVYCIIIYSIYNKSIEFVLTLTKGAKYVQNTIRYIC